MKLPAARQRRSGPRALAGPRRHASHVPRVTLRTAIAVECAFVLAAVPRFWLMSMEIEAALPSRPRSTQRDRCDSLARDQRSVGSVNTCSSMATHLSATLCWHLSREELLETR